MNTDNFHGHRFVPCWEKRGEKSLGVTTLPGFLDIKSFFHLFLRGPKPDLSNGWVRWVVLGGRRNKTTFSFAAIVYIPLYSPVTSRVIKKTWEGKVRLCSSLMMLCWFGRSLIIKLFQSLLPNKQSLTKLLPNQQSLIIKLFPVTTVVLTLTQEMIWMKWTDVRCSTEGRLL